MELIGFNGTYCFYWIYDLLIAYCLLGPNGAYWV